MYLQGSSGGVFPGFIAKCCTAKAMPEDFLDEKHFVFFVLFILNSGLTPVSGLFNEMKNNSDSS